MQVRRGMEKVSDPTFQPRVETRKAVVGIAADRLGGNGKEAMRAVGLDVAPFIDPPCSTSNVLPQ
jgi:hypothetical protein